MILHKQGVGVKTRDVKGSTDSYSEGVRTVYKQVQPPKKRLGEIGQVEVSGARQEATEQTDRLERAIDHFCTTDLPREQKLRILDRAENYLRYISQSASEEWQQFATLERRHYISSRLS